MSVPLLASKKKVLFRSTTTTTKYIVYMSKFIHFFYFFLAWHRFAFLREMNIFRVPEIHWRRRSSLFTATERCCRLHTSPLVSFYAFSLYRFYHSRRYPTFLPRCIPASSFSLLHALRKDTTAADKIYYKICLLCSLSMLVLYFCSGQSEKRNSSSNEYKSSEWSMNASATSLRVILFQILYFSQLSKAFLLHQ